MKELGTAYSNMGAAARMSAGSLSGRNLRLATVIPSAARNHALLRGGSKFRARLIDQEGA
jgi:hypothetical protein